MANWMYNNIDNNIADVREIVIKGVPVGDSLLY